MKEIVLAGGCFWGVDEFFRRKDGILSTESVYVNCNKENPTYEEVCSQLTDCVEAVKLEYDENIISIENIMEELYSVINPFSKNRQGGDIGSQYRTGFYYQNEEDKKKMKDFIIKKQAKNKKEIMIEVEPLENIWPAEEYHQKYLVKNPHGYCHIVLD